MNQNTFKMKTTAIITSIMVFLITISLQAQTTSSSKTKSSSTISIHSDSDDKNSSYSYSDSSKQNSNVSVSISNSDDSYVLRAKFPKEKYEEVKTVLLKELNQKNYRAKSSETHRWTSSTNKDEVYDVTLSGTKLSIDLDKDVASASLVEKFETLGLTLRSIIIGKQNEARREAERLQREADRLRRDAERMQREADRIQREAERQAANDSRQYRDDARRLADEARRLADEASNLNSEATHKGAIGATVKRLLSDSKTIFPEGSKNSFNWTWPEAQQEILANLKSDKLIQTEDEVVFIKDNVGIHVNGKHLSKNQAAKYNNILVKNDIYRTHYFTFYKNYDNIVLVNDNANLEGFIRDAVYKNILDSAKKKVKLELNGSSTSKNGNTITTDVLTKLNKILLQNKIIPAPGKIFEIMKPENYKLGYSLGKKTHLGTWQFSN